MYKQPPNSLLRMCPSYSTTKLPEQLHHGVCVIGNFDGLHRGHRELIAQALAYAKQRNAPCIVISFSPHPQDFFLPDNTRLTLTTIEHQRIILETLGVDALYLIQFDHSFRMLSPTEFMKHLVHKLKVQAIFVGSNFTFGKNREGTVKDFIALGQQFSVKCVALPLLTDHGEIISSSLIRSLLHQGDITQANALLGYCWFVSSVVIKGDQRGRTLGYPTANLMLPERMTFKMGIYAARCYLDDGTRYDAVVSYGVRPTFLSDGQRLFEVHLFGLNTEIYGQTLYVELIAYIRDELKFDRLDALIQRMDEDSRQAQNLCAHNDCLSVLSSAFCLP